MAGKVETIASNFIGDFKVGDNLLRNAAALCHLRDTNKNGIFNKLIVVQAGSIVEAALDQIIYRAQNYTSEGVPNISDADLKKIRDTKIEQFNNIIQAMKSPFDDEPQGTGRDDDTAFSDDVVKWSLALCIRVLKHLCDRFPRPKELGVYAHDLSIPTV